MRLFGFFTFVPHVVVSSHFATMDMVEATVNVLFSLCSFVRVLPSMCLRAACCHTPGSSYTIVAFLKGNWVMRRKRGGNTRYET